MGNGRRFLIATGDRSSSSMETAGDVPLSWHCRMPDRLPQGPPISLGLLDLKVKHVGREVCWWFLMSLRPRSLPDGVDVPVPDSVGMSHMRDHRQEDQTTEVKEVLRQLIQQNSQLKSEIEDLKRQVKDKRATRSSSPREAAAVMDVQGGQPVQVASSEQVSRPVEVPAQDSEDVSGKGRNQGMPLRWGAFTPAQRPIERLQRPRLQVQGMIPGLPVPENQMY
eukprot:s119_g28.t1